LNTNKDVLHGVLFQEGERKTSLFLSKHKKNIPKQTNQNEKRRN